VTDLVEQLNELNWKEPVPDDLQSEVRMRFNEAIAGGPNTNGDAGPTLTVNHALDCLYATARIETLEAALREALDMVVDAARDSDYSVSEHIRLQRELGNQPRVRMCEPKE
jgi:hypothetical protein